MTWTPKGWWTPISSAPVGLRLGYVCQCAGCTSDGQHNPLCEIHELPPKACDCARGEATKIPPASDVPSDVL
jgi:hypothetical protein